MIITEKDKELFFKNGYLVIKNFLNKNEVDEFREYVSQEYLKKRFLLNHYQFIGL